MRQRLQDIGISVKGISIEITVNNPVNAGLTCVNQN